MEIRKNINRSLPLQIIIQKINYHLIKENNSLAFWENIYIYIEPIYSNFDGFFFSSIEIIHRISKRKNRVSNRNEMESNKCSKFSNAVKRSRVLTISFLFRKKKKIFYHDFHGCVFRFSITSRSVRKKKKKKEKFRRIVFVMAREVESGSRKKDLPQGLVRRAAKRLVWERWNNVHFSL